MPIFVFAEPSQATFVSYPRLLFVLQWQSSVIATETIWPSEFIYLFGCTGSLWRTGFSLAVALELLHSSILCMQATRHVVS